MDLAEYRTLFVLSFTTPAFDPDVAPSFGTLLATINVALGMLSEVGCGRPRRSASVNQKFKNDDLLLLVFRWRRGRSRPL